MGNPLQFEDSFRVGSVICERAYPEHGRMLAPSIREIDKEECRLTLPKGRTLGDKLAASVSVSTEAFAVSDDHGFIHGLWGYGPISERSGVHGAGFVWFVSDDWLMSKNGKANTRFSREVVFPKMEKLYNLFGNIMMAKNTKHVRWLTSAGFVEVNTSTKRGRKMVSIFRQGNRPCVTLSP